MRAATAERRRPERRKPEHWLADPDRRVGPPSGDLVTIDALAVSVPPYSREMTPIRVDTLRRWAVVGLYGVRLETVVVRRAILSSRDALRRFFDRVDDVIRRGEAGQKRIVEVAMPRSVPTPKVREADVLKAAMDALTMFGFRPERRNIMAVEVVSPKGKRRLVRNGAPGQADISATVPSGPHRGKRVEIEVKRPGERPRPEQVEFLRSVNESGGLGFWIDDAGRLAHLLGRLLDGWAVELDDDGVPWVVRPEPGED